MTEPSPFMQKSLFLLPRYRMDLLDALTSTPAQAYSADDMAATANMLAFRDTMFSRDAFEESMLEMGFDVHNNQSGYLASIFEDIAVRTHVRTWMISELVNDIQDDMEKFKDAYLPAE